MCPHDTPSPWRRSRSPLNPPSCLPSDCVRLAALLPLAPLLLLLVLRQDDHEPHKDGDKVDEEIERMLDVVLLPTDCTLHNDLRVVDDVRAEDEQARIQLQLK